MTKIRRRYHFYGRVQGVGFRYTARHAAAALGLTGWVRNEYDGSVTMEAQGNIPSLNLLPSMIEDGRYIRIDHVEVCEIPLVDTEREFSVRC